MDRKIVKDSNSSSSSSSSSGTNGTATPNNTNFQQQKLSLTEQQQQQQQPQQQSGYSFFPEIFTRFVMGRPGPKQSLALANSSQFDKKPDKMTTTSSHEEKIQERHYAAIVLPPPAQPKRACRAPLARKFAHPCTCGQSSHSKHQQQSQVSLLTSSSSPNGTNVNSSVNLLPPVAYTSPLQLYDPILKKCLPTSRTRDMLLRECHLPQQATLQNSAQAITGGFATTGRPSQLQQQQLLQQQQQQQPQQQLHQNLTNPCYYDDLICDENRLRCVCKPPLHLFYESNHTTFGCVPIGPYGSADGLIHCRPGYVYNVISKECQKVFDVNELPLHYTPVVSATQFSFVTIVLIWVLLLILIVTAKLRKIRTNVYGSSSSSNGRRTTSRNRNSSHGAHGSGSSRAGGTPSWLHPLITVVNGHQHLNQHRTTVDRHANLSRDMTIDDAGSFNDTDFFLANHGRTFNEILGSNNYVGSQLSINNPPPKFEEIYPSCPEEQSQRQNAGAETPPHRHCRRASDEELPTYDEAMKMHNTKPPDQKAD